MTQSDDQTRFREQDEASTQKRATLLNLQYFDTRGRVAGMSLVQGVLKIEEMRHGFLVPLSDGAESEPLIFGITVQTPQSLLRELQERFPNRAVRFYMISVAGFHEFMERFDPPKRVVYEDVKIAKEGDSQTITEVSHTLEQVRSDDMLSYLVAQADRLNASDIHLECQRDGVRIRFRVYGNLHPVAELTKDKYRILIAAIASRANVSTAGTEAQTGHMQQDIKQSDGTTTALNMRVETIPTLYGQDAVIRLFNFDERRLDIRQRGLSDDQVKLFEAIINRPHGMLLVVGPTGSGKSTMLYSLIKELNSPSRKILTLEDPVEYSIPGVAQVPVNTDSGDSFAEKLRSVLRLDPDVIMIGEIRDLDTARTALQASITGHLVLGTFHADTAASAFSRLIDMVGKNPIFATAIRMIVAQRLVRRLDDSTKIPYQPDEATKRYIKSVLQDLPEVVVRRDLDNLTLYKPGSSEAAPFGYVDRLVLIEQLVVTERIQAFLRGEVQDINLTAIEDAAKAEGMVTMQQDGVLKVLEGLTTLEEINRVI